MKTPPDRIVAGVYFKWSPARKAWIRQTGKYIVWLERWSSVSGQRWACFFGRTDMGMDDHATGRSALAAFRSLDAKMRRWRERQDQYDALTRVRKDRRS